MEAYTMILGFCFTGLVLYLISSYVQTRYTSLPPGPPGWPLIGNLLDLWQDAPYKTLGAMNNKYASVVTVSVCGTQYVVINSTEAATDLLEKKGGITANRPYSTMGADLIGWSKSTAFLQNGHTLRKHRKAFSRYILNKGNPERFLPEKVTEAKRFMCNVLANPDGLVAHCHATTSALTLKISHGYNMKDDDPLVRVLNEAVRVISDTMVPGRYLVNSFSFLQHFPGWFPGCGFLKDVKQWRQVMNEAISVPHNFVLEQLTTGNAVPSLTSQLLEDSTYAEDEDTLKWISFTMYLAGSNAIPTMLTAFFLAMTMYPEIFKKAQAEIDTVVGNGRLPVIEDRARLQYVNAIITELIRWNVFTPIMSHVSTQDILYNGYLIPKGTHFIANIWFILNNPETYPNPEVFDPQRFLGENPQPDPRNAAFGWGRRRCPGLRMMDAVLFTYISMALAVLDVSRYAKEGEESVPKHEYNEGILRSIKPFKCKIAPRSKNVKEILRA